MVIDLAKSQDQRTERAKEMLAMNAVSVQETAPNEWVVQNGDGEPYEVAQHAMGDYSCTCMDFQRVKKMGVRCKHIEAVRLSVINQRDSNSGSQTKPKEVLQMENENNTSNGWVKLYHPVAGGIQCTLPLPTVALTIDQAKAMFDSLNRLLEAGFVTSQAGLEDGESKEAVTHLARHSKANSDSTTTPIIDVYCNGNFKVVGIYLNTLDDQEAFFDAFGIGLNTIPLWEGDASIERGKNADRDKKYIVPVSGVDVIYKLNPKWEGDDDKKHAKRMFVRWEKKVSTPKAAVPSKTETNIVPPPPPPAPAVSTETPVSETLVADLARKYQDGTEPVKEAEIQAFDVYVQKNGKVPESLQALRASWAG